MTEKSKIVIQYRSAVRILDGQRRLLIEAGANAEKIEAVSTIIRYLNGLSDASVIKLFGGKMHRESERQQREAAVIRASTMTLEEIENKLASDNITRIELEAIAVGRFEFPRGSLRSLGNIDNLKDKICTLVNNERSHLAISAAASKEKN